MTAATTKRLSSDFRISVVNATEAFTPHTVRGKDHGGVYKRMPTESRVNPTDSYT